MLSVKILVDKHGYIRKILRASIIIGFAFITLLAVDTAVTIYGYRVPPTGEPSLDPDFLADFMVDIRENRIPMHGIVVVRNGEIAFEAYWPPFSAKHRHSVESNTKAVIGALIGIAIDQKAIMSAEVPVTTFFPERQLRGESSYNPTSVALRDLLTMRSGRSDDGLWSASNWTKFALDRPELNPPGTTWRYSNADAHLLSAILRKAVRMDARIFANRFLFQPLGIREVTAADWSPAPEGIAAGHAGLRLTVRELARFGQLYLNGGRFDGKRVVSEQWVRSSTNIQTGKWCDSFTNEQVRGFGYLWSVFPDDGYFGFLGRGGQNLIVVPDRELVIAMTAGLAPGKEGSLLRLVNRYLIPACDNRYATLEALATPMAAEAAARLESELATLTETRTEAPTIPRAWLAVNGHTWRFNANDFGWNRMVFYFENDKESASVSVSGLGTLAIGLDGRYRVTEIGNGQAIALRGRFEEGGLLRLENQELGSFVKIEAVFTLDGDRLIANVRDGNELGIKALVVGQRIE